MISPIAGSSHEQFLDFVLALDKQQTKGHPAMKSCPTHGGILAVNREGILYCTDTKARTCDYMEMGVDQAARS